MVTYFDFRRNRKNSRDFVQVKCHEEISTEAGLVSPPPRNSGEKSTTGVGKKPQGKEV
jgi:hypothetical protein